MKLLKSFLSRFRFFQNSTYNQQNQGPLAYLRSKIQAISFIPGRQNANFRLIAPSNEEKLGLPQNNNNQNIPQIGSFIHLSSLSQMNSTSIQNQDFHNFKSTLEKTNYQLLFKGAPPLNLKVLEKWSDLPIVASVKNLLTKSFGENLSPLEKVVLPSILSGENHVIQHLADRATNMMFLIPAIMFLLQIDPVEEEQNQIKVLILAKDEQSVQSVNEDITQLKSIFSQGYNLHHLQQQVVVDTPKNILSQLKENKINLKFVKYFVVNDLTAMYEQGYESDIIAVNSYTSAEKQTVIVSEKLRNDYLVIDNLMANFKFYIYVLTQYAQVVLEDYAFKASLWTILMLLLIICYLTYKIQSNPDKKKEK
ncbi:transmembrane protein, putative (macronuclear) [Tetrahymena thermophila SB210]|uniref:Transmembrane protein, putative n=1 Tax=Tetrahymena thermophila (strain SB210) TaxID=312017 RepID=Q23U12_TETTS|nr:transmembrane protein, putative [Tetrahymena thermophila SB210]EAS00037.2 transmembrane protein, putative [Tetrahymena thermophila SB210]|eukprot:XP_001020283.2 transmembrane protein, putative [Tetrahymena thermophila SB210]